MMVWCVWSVMVQCVEGSVMVQCVECDGAVCGGSVMHTCAWSVMV